MLTSQFSGIPLSPRPLQQNPIQQFQQDQTALPCKACWLQTNVTARA